MTYTNKQIAKQIANTILESQYVESSFNNGILIYNNQTFYLPQQNSPKRKTNLINR